MNINNKHDIYYPIFITGVPRSGTTLLSQLINVSKEIHIGTETHFFQITKPLSKNNTIHEVKDFYLNPKKNRFLRYFDLNETQLKEIKKECQEAQTINELLSTICSFESKRVNISRWGEKTPAHDIAYEKIFKHFPNAKIINITRDPRAVFQSNLKIKWVSKNPLKLTNRFKKNQKVIKRNINNTQFISIRYEDLITKPQDILINLFSQIDLKYSEKVIHEFNNPSNRNFNNSLESWKDNSYQGIDSKKVEEWNKEELKKINSFIAWILKDELLNQGYKYINENSLFCNIILFTKYSAKNLISTILKIQSINLARLLNIKI